MKLRKNNATTNSGSDLVALAGVIINVIRRLDLDQESRDFVEVELKWLFGAADHLNQAYQSMQKQVDQEKKRINKEHRNLDSLKNRPMEESLTRIGRETIKQSSPLSIPPPPEAEQHSDMTNRILALPGLGYEGEARLGRVFNPIPPLIKRINISLRPLNLLLDREAALGTAAKSDIPLQSQIRQYHLQILQILQEMAGLMKQVYGIYVTAPDQLVEFLEKN